jgi:hypothetical protein
MAFIDEQMVYDLQLSISLGQRRQLNSSPLATPRYPFFLIQ